MKNLFVCAFACTIAVIFFSCSKNNDAAPAQNQQEVSLMLTDGPGIFEHVFIDIQSVEVVIDTCKSHQGDFDEQGDDEATTDCVVHETLDIKPGVYDVLQFRNGLDTLLAHGTVMPGLAKVIKIKLGTNNSIVLNGTTYPLAASNSDDLNITLRLRGDEWEYEDNSHMRLWLDFDVFRSIVDLGNSHFKLKPFIHFFNEHTRAELKGEIEPIEALPVVSIFNDADTVMALPNSSGEFKVKNLKTGTYTVMVKSLAGYQDEIKTNISVEAGKETDLGTITMHK